ncbi:tetratricopeptide repeat protein [Streptomyces cyaneofuscatus]|uniref:tetratricopeptide repeat protein n=1 Tax=Streptomyces cyaneofuscatus TaxID=66883 RepID=UPI0013DB96CD|nr:tetratricopeptide repeat protein [Streptomyces cyaneofuscatus]
MATIGSAVPWKVNVRQWAGFGGKIVDSPVEVTAGARTQGERRLQWDAQLLALARKVRARRVLLLVDTCEWLTYFDDARVERPRAGHPYGVGEWFGGVLHRLLTAMPNLRVVLAGTVSPALRELEDHSPGLIVRMELEPWKATDARTYLALRGLHLTHDTVETLTEVEEGLPVAITWIADVLTGALEESGDSAEPIGQVEEGLCNLAAATGPARAAWLDQHVLARISAGTLQLLHAAAVLGTFTPVALLSVVHGDTASSESFDRLARSSCVIPCPGREGEWQLHSVMRSWLLRSAREHDSQHPPAHRLLPQLHRAAAEFHEALAGDSVWSLRAAHHRFALGETIYAAEWTARVDAALHTVPLDSLGVRLLTDAVLTVPSIECHEEMRSTVAKAHLAAAYLAYHHGQHTAAQRHAEQAMSLYRVLNDHQNCVYVSARLAGQAAWRRPRYHDAVTHWGTALRARSMAFGTDLARYPSTEDDELRLALAEALYRTGDSTAARAALNAVLSHGPESPAPAPCTASQRRNDRDTPHHSFPVLALADEAPSGTRRIQECLLRAEIAVQLDSYAEATALTQRYLKDSAMDDHHSARSHALLAQIARLKWDLKSAEFHLSHSSTAARRCACSRCHVQTLLTRADIAEWQAVWMPPTAAPGASATTLSQSRRTAATAHQQRALVDRATALNLSRDMHDRYLEARALAETDPSAALVLYREFGNQRSEANALHAIAEDIMLRDAVQAQELASQALTLYRRMGQKLGQANTLHLLATITDFRGKTLLAEQQAAQARSIYRIIGDRHGEANVLNIMADIALQSGDLDRAEERGLKALALHRTIGTQVGEANLLLLLAGVAGHRENLIRSEELGRHALSLFRVTGERQGEANALLHLADAATSRDNLDGAEDLGRQALMLFRQNNDQLGEANALRHLGDVAFTRSHLDRAEELGTQALALFHRAGQQLGKGSALRLLADIAQERGDLRRADRVGEKSLALFDAIDHRLGKARSLLSLGDTARLSGNLDRSEELGEKALALFRALRAPSGEANAIRLLAEVAHLRGHHSDAQRLMRKAITLYDAVAPEIAAWYRRRLQEW